MLNLTPDDDINIEDSGDHTKEKSKKICEFCLIEFSNLAQLKKHKNTLHPMPVVCEECGNVFKHEDSLKDHVERIHKGVKRGHAKVCPICGKNLSPGTNLSRHIRTHSQAQQFCCNICGNTFKEMHNLRAHEKTHEDLRPFKCSKVGCNKAFLRKRDLARHEETHLRPEGKYTNYFYMHF